MGITLSLLLVAAGAILRYAVSALVSGVNLQTVGLILMVVGAVGVVLSLAAWSTWGGWRRRDVVADGSVVRTVVEETR